MASTSGSKRARALDNVGGGRILTGVMGSVLYSLARLILDAIAVRHTDEAKLRAEVLALRRQVQVLERQIARVRWTPASTSLPR